MAYARLATNYSNMGEMGPAAEAAGKAYELRGRVSERERFYIDSHYEDNLTGDLEAARRIYEQWAETYPRDDIPLNNLSLIYTSLGEHEEALTARRQALKLGPGSAEHYLNLVGAYLYLNRLPEAIATAREMQAHNLDSPLNHMHLYQIAFLQHDAAAMEREAAVPMGQPGWEDSMLQIESDTAAYAGQLTKARELTRRAVESARRADEKEPALDYEAEGALREALVGNMNLVREQPSAHSGLARGANGETMSAIALGLSGDSAAAARLSDDLSHRFPKDTLVQFQYLPMIRAATMLGGKGASQNTEGAIEALAAAAPYERGNSGENVRFGLYPAYLRGTAYLAAHQGAAAAAEFQKVLDYPGVVLNEPIGALARLGLGRAYALEGGIDVGPASARSSRPQETTSQPEAVARARNAYLDFLVLWKDGDPDVPILVQAKAEYAGLH
jgi:eukaryotic-like serine/threonine-protein kinase